MSDIDNITSPTQTDSISRSAQKNREIMSEALLEVGFVNYPTEYWHWSYGDRYWAFQTNQRYAIYGTIK
jgi:D-alanyl-D-alanine dipeptidase